MLCISSLNRIKGIVDKLGSIKSVTLILVLLKTQLWINRRLKDSSSLIADRE